MALFERLASLRNSASARALGRCKVCGKFRILYTLFANAGDRLAINLQHLANLAVARLRIGLDVVGYRLAPLLGGQMPAEDVCRQDEFYRIE